MPSDYLPEGRALAPGRAVERLCASICILPLAGAGPLSGRCLPSGWSGRSVQGEGRSPARRVALDGSCAAPLLPRPVGLPVTILRLAARGRRWRLCDAARCLLSAAAICSAQSRGDLFASGLAFHKTRYLPLLGHGLKSGFSRRSLPGPFCGAVGLAVPSFLSPIKKKRAQPFLFLLFYSSCGNRRMKTIACRSIGDISGRTGDVSGRSGDISGANCA